jgi:hypothetical protein
MSMLLPLSREWPVIFLLPGLKDCVSGIWIMHGVTFFPSKNGKLILLV